MLDILILNRNLKDVTDLLVADVKSRVSGNSLVGVIDSGSRDEEVSRHTVVQEDGLDAKLKGLRVNRGFNLGIDWWLRGNPQSDWLMLLPNDAEICRWESNSFERLLETDLALAAIYPIAPRSGYANALEPQESGLLWNIQEGPIVLSRKFCEMMVSGKSRVFDPENFRGYLSFLELSMRAYANNLAIAGTTLVSFSENEDHLLSKAHLIGTEEMSHNLKLLIEEGEDWLLSKYGLRDRWSMENIVRLLFDEYVRVNPGLGLREIV